MEQPHHGVLVLGLVVAGGQIDAVGQLLAKQLGGVGGAVAAVPVADLQSLAAGDGEAQLDLAGFGVGARDAEGALGGVPVIAVLIQIDGSVGIHHVHRVVSDLLELSGSRGDAVGLGVGVVVVVFRHGGGKGVDVVGLDGLDLGRHGGGDFLRLHDLGGQALQGADGQVVAADGVEVAGVEAAEGVVVIQADGDLVGAALVEDLGGDGVLALDLPIGLDPLDLVGGVLGGVVEAAGLGHVDDGLAVSVGEAAGGHGLTVDIDHVVVVNDAQQEGHFIVLGEILGQVKLPDHPGLGPGGGNVVGQQTAGLGVIIGHGIGIPALPVGLVGQNGGLGVGPVPLGECRHIGEILEHLGVGTVEFIVPFAVQGHVLGGIVVRLGGGNGYRAGHDRGKQDRQGQQSS